MYLKVITMHFLPNKINLLLLLAHFLLGQLSVNLNLLLLHHLLTLLVLILMFHHPQFRLVDLLVYLHQELKSSHLPVFLSNLQIILNKLSNLQVNCLLIHPNPKNPDIHNLFL